MPKRKRSVSASTSSGKRVKYNYLGKRSVGSNTRPSKVLARIKRVENIINKTIENKHVDYQATTVNGDQIYAASPVEKLAFFRMSGTGAGESERVGDKVTLMSQRFLMNLKRGGQDNQVRVLIVENVGFDNATDLQITDVLEYGSWSTDNNTVFTSPYKIGADATKRYRVLYDKVFHLHSNRPYVKIDFTKKYGTKTNPGKVCSYEVDTADFPNNHRINAFAISDYPTGVTPPTITMLCRNRYKDA